MKKRNVVRFLSYPLLFCAMAFAFTQYSDRSNVGAALCCSYGEDCCRAGKTCTTKCCYPGITEAQCSEAKRNYCRGTC